MEVCLVVFVIILMMFGLNVVDGHRAHVMGIIGVVVVGVGVVVGGGWLGYLSAMGVRSWRK